MTSRPATVGIVGLGYGRAHIAGFQAAGCKVVSLCQRNADQAASIAARYGVPHVYARWEDMLEKSCPDIVVIATPPALHLPILSAAVAAGAHVVCEKPLATSADEALQMIAAARTANRAAIVGFNWRFTAAVQRMKAMVDAGYLGRVFHINCHWFNASWWTQRLCRPGAWIAPWRGMARSATWASI